MRKFLLLLCIIPISLPVFAQSYLLAGKIITSSNKPAAFASVYIKNSVYGTSANESGYYQLKLAPGIYDVVYRFAGYKEVVEKITIADRDLRHDVKFAEPSTYQPAGGTAPDPGMEIMRQVLASRKRYLKQAKQYSCTVYVKGVQKLDNVPISAGNQAAANNLSVDSTGKGMLYQSESLSDLSFKPNKLKEEMIASRSAGHNTAFTYSRASDLRVDFYQNIFMVPGLSSHGFISPLGRQAMLYYRYKLIGSRRESDLTIHKLQVIPKRHYDPVFTGSIEIVEGTWRLYAAELMLTDKDNALDLIDTLKVSQQFIPVADSVWQPLSTLYSFKGGVLGFEFEGYYLSVYNNYNLNPDFAEHFFNGERMREDTFENSRDTAYWGKARPVPLTRQENTDYAQKDFRAELERSMEKYDLDKSRKNRFVLSQYLLYGYKASFNDNKDSVFVDPFIETFFYNTVEGAGIKLGGAYRHYYHDLRSYTITPSLRYGYADKLFNASLRSSYIYDPASRGAFTAGFGSEILDLNNVGTRSLYFNTLSTLLSEQNFVKYYRSQFGEFGYQRDLTNGIFLSADLTYASRTQLYNNSYYALITAAGRHFTSNNPLMPDAPANDRSELFPQNQALTLAASLTFTFDQQYTSRPAGRTYETSPYPQIRVNYRKGIDGLFGSDVNYDFASLEFFQEHLLTGITGVSSFKFVAGDFFNRKTLYFMDYNHFLGNQGTTFDPTPGTFHFLPFYIYSADGAFLEAHYEHNFTGYLFNNIPLIRSLKLNEIVGLNYLTENNNRNYSEFYAGLQRLLFRVDYGLSFTGSHRYLQGFRIFYGIK
jgi:hypothetical protein